jgi:VanZ family protein
MRFLKILLLSGWLLVILFPTAWLARQTRVTGYWFETFTPEWVHIVAHTTIFAALTMMVLSVFPRHWLAFVATLLLALFVGILQEGIQVAAAGMRPGWEEVFDLCVDLFGALCGMTLVILTRTISALVRPNRGFSHR